MAESSKITIKLKVGLIACACFAAAGLLFLLGEDPLQSLYFSAFWRVGLVMGALWMAVPSGAENLTWARSVPIIIGAVVLVVWSRKALLTMLPATLALGVALIILRPRDKRRTPRR